MWVSLTSENQKILVKQSVQRTLLVKMCSERPTCFCLLPIPNSIAIQKTFLAIHLSLSKNVQVFIEIIPLPFYTNIGVLYTI